MIETEVPKRSERSRLRCPIHGTPVKPAFEDERSPKFCNWLSSLWTCPRCPPVIAVELGYTLGPKTAKVPRHWTWVELCASPYNEFLRASNHE